MNVVLFKGANGPEGHLIIGDDHGGEMTPMTGHEGRGRGEARRGGEIAIGKRPGVQPAFFNAVSHP